MDYTLILIILGVIAAIGLIAAWVNFLGNISQKRYIAAETFFEGITDGQYYDIVDLYDHFLVLPTAKGVDITRINASLRNLRDKNIGILIKPGTCFYPSEGNHQMMVSRKEIRITVKPKSVEHVEVPVSCLNASRPIPTKDNLFSGVGRVSENLNKFITNTIKEDKMVIQAGIWAITDNYSEQDIIERLIARNNHGISNRAISSSQISRARIILNSLDIRHRL